MELDLEELERWLATAVAHEARTGLKLALDRNIIRELLKRAKELEAIKQTQKEN